MSAWRTQAARSLPELWKDEHARTSPYLFFFEVLPFVRDAHRSGDESVLRRAYGFAWWCHSQEGEVRNAVGVAFYEHLFDAWDTHADVLRWLDRRVLHDCWALFDGRLDADKLEVLRAHRMGRHAGEA